MQLNMMKRYTHYLIPFSLVLLTSLLGCSSVSSAGDGAPKYFTDVSHVRNAVPKAEPKSRYGNPKSYVVRGKRYYVKNSAKGYNRKGTASWYGTLFHGRRTSSGEKYNMYAMTAAHKTLPLPTYARVTNLDNGKSIIVKINDRGPFIGKRLIDLSYAAARKLGVYKTGTARVKVKAITTGHAAPVRVARKSGSKHKPLYLQAGVFSQYDNARILLSQLKGLDVSKATIKRRKHGGERVFKVQIGPFKNLNVLNRIKRRLASADIYSHLVSASA